MKSFFAVAVSAVMVAFFLTSGSDGQQVRPAPLRIIASRIPVIGSRLPILQVTQPQAQPQPQQATRLNNNIFRPLVFSNSGRPINETDKIDDYDLHLPKRQTEYYTVDYYFEEY